MLLLAKLKNAGALILFLFLLSCAAADENASFDPLAPKAHHTANGFRNLYVDDSTKPGFFDFLLKVRFQESWPDEGELLLNSPTPKISVDLSQIDNPPANELQVTWIGHSTMLIQYEGLTVLTDPMFSDRASPVSFAGPRRYMAPAITLEDLPPIDAVVISHNHYDHMDEDTITAIGNSARWFVPLGNAKLLKQNGVTNVIEKDWWETATLKDINFTLTPTQHWSGRGLFDRYEALWGSWAIQFTNADARLWFGGDTGYNDVQFKQIGDRHGPFDLSFIPIGAYEPRWFMKTAHINPVEAVKIHQDIKSTKSIGIHWGTFVLTSEEVDEPPKMLKKALKDAGLPSDVFISLPVGGMERYSLSNSKVLATN